MARFLGGIKRKINGNDVVFSNGKQAYANNGIIGLSEPDEGDGWDISEGYDGTIFVENLTKDEKIELADYMINLWQRFKPEI